MRFLIKVGYHCSEINDEPRWFIAEQDRLLKLGVINNSLSGGGPLPYHGCKKDEYREDCNEDITCNWQEILEIRQYSPKEARNLGLQNLEVITLI